MNTKMTRFKSLHPCTLVESSFSIGMVKPHKSTLPAVTCTMFWMKNYGSGTSIYNKYLETIIMEGRASHISRFLLSSNFMTITFLLKMRKCAFFNTPITFGQSGIWKKYDTLHSKILIAPSAPNANHVRKYLIPKKHV